MCLLCIFIHINLIQLFEILKLVIIQDRIDLKLVHLTQVVQDCVVFEKVTVCKFVLISLFLQEVLYVVIHVIFG